MLRLLEVLLNMTLMGVLLLTLSVPPPDLALQDLQALYLVKEVLQLLANKWVALTWTPKDNKLIPPDNKVPSKQASATLWLARLVSTTTIGKTTDTQSNTICRPTDHTTLTTLETSSSSNRTKTMFTTWTMAKDKPSLSMLMVDSMLEITLEKWRLFTLTNKAKLTILIWLVKDITWIEANLANNSKVLNSKVLNSKDLSNYKVLSNSRALNNSKVPNNSKAKEIPQELESFTTLTCKVSIMNFLLTLKVVSTRITTEKTTVLLLKEELTTWIPMVKDINLISILSVKSILLKMA